MHRGRCPARTVADDRPPLEAVRCWMCMAWQNHRWHTPRRLQPPRGRAFVVNPCQSIAACTRFDTRSSRMECHGSGDTKLVRYVNDTPLSGSAHEYDEPTPP